MNLGGGGCSEPRLYHCTLAWATECDSISKKKKTSLLIDSNIVAFLREQALLHEALGVCTCRVHGCDSLSLRQDKDDRI